ncbi:MAG: ATP-binding protein [Candidatus Methanomethylophilaceae archaeon]|nr:ATP-binding protein [Candidatus Methanomethylophilaceae archaeon]MBR7153423.1 ATP-binding protein [Candidatus Methanomethylophilaceae archaeon]
MGKDVVIYRRKAYDVLREWKRRSNGSTAMLVEGSRRVGKSTLVNNFGNNEYSVCVLIDFSKVSSTVKALFDDLEDIDSLLRGLQLHTKRVFKNRDTLIIFDEVQRFPRARESIKALVQDGRYDYIETGSLISIKKNVAGILIPSEEESFTLHPMDFEEFLWANGDETFGLLEDAFLDRGGLDDHTHSVMMKRYMEYMAVGGMPQAVEAFVNGMSYQEIDRVKRSIIKLYIDDFRKIDESGMIGSYFVRTPSELSRGTTRYRTTYIEATVGRKKELELFAELEDSKTVIVNHHVHDPRVGMSMTVDREFFKMYLEDTGLFVTLCFMDKDVSDNIIYEHLVSGRLPANLGFVFENAVAQALTAAGYKAFYHTFLKDDGKHSYEVDFIIPSGERICPIEVKSSRINPHKSLDKFIEKYGKVIDIPIMISTKNIRMIGDILNIPIYMTGFLNRRRL